MNNMINSGMKWGQRALVMKIGKTALKRGGIIGVGVGALAGAGYLAYNLLEKRKRKEEVRRQDLTRIDDINDNNPEISGDKKIVV